MALRLGEYVVYGELRNNRNYATHGVLVLRTPEGAEQCVLHLDLTGDCEADLKGRVIRFQPLHPDAPGRFFVEEEQPRLHFHQIGPTGQLTADGWARELPCSEEEYLRRCALGEPPPTPWKRRLYLEWYSQNGRVVVEMLDPLLEEQVVAPEDNSEGVWRALPHLAPHPEAGNAAQKAPRLEFLQDPPEGEHTPSRSWNNPEEEEEEVEYESIPDSLQDALDAEAFSTDFALEHDEDPDEDDPLRDIKLLDYCFEHVNGEFIGSIFGPDTLPPADALSNEAAEGQLKVLLSELAQRNIALHVCEHFSAKDAYRYLVEHILPECTYFKEMTGSGYVQNFHTGEACPACEAKALEDYSELTEQFDGPSAEDAGDEKDTPF